MFAFSTFTPPRVYVEGMGVPKAYVKAFQVPLFHNVVTFVVILVVGQYFRQAADLGNSRAQFSLGKPPMDPKVGFYPIVSPYYICSPGVMYEYGQGVGQNFQEAAKWFKQAAGQVGRGRCGRSNGGPQRVQCLK